MHKAAWRTTPTIRRHGAKLLAHCFKLALIVQVGYFKRPSPGIPDDRAQSE
jgi:hypothetical protein